MPVLLNEVMIALEPKPNRTYIDATFGDGGYSRRILETANCKVIAIDQDPTVLGQANDLKSEFKDRFEFFNNKFSEMDEIIEKLEIENLDGVVFDLGVSSMQIDNKNRGFSFQKEGKLDMRMSQKGLSAEDAINDLSETDLADIIFQYGDETKSRKIAKKILDIRAKERIETTAQLTQIVLSCFPKKYYKTHPATKTFQAIRIFVNEEIEELIKGINLTSKYLSENGKLCLVTFHSIEDRIVKNFFKITSSKNYVLNQDQKKILYQSNRKPIMPSKEEIEANRRARSAKLRFGYRNTNDYYLINTKELGFI